MLRNSFKYVNYSNLKKFFSDFKAVYNASIETSALSEPEKIEEKCGKKYPYAISKWVNNWEDISSFFQFSDDIRRIMYTINIIDGFNRQYRKVTKSKSVFPSDNALEKSTPVLLSATLAVLLETSGLIPEAGCGQRPRIVLLPISVYHTKNMYKT